MRLPGGPWRLSLVEVCGGLLLVLLSAACAAAGGGGETGAGAGDAVPPSFSADAAAPAGAGAGGAAPEAPTLSVFSIGGDFELTDDAGRPFRLSDHRGEVFLLFFGYASCPDYCPATMSRLARAYEFLGQEGKRVRTLFVTVDPVNDTPERLAEFLSYFGAVPALGLTGSAEQIEAVARAYAARYERLESSPPDAPVFAHTSYVYLIDGRGRVRYTFQSDDAPAFIAAGVRALLEPRE